MDEDKIRGEKDLENGLSQSGENHFEEQESLDEPDSEREPEPEDEQGKKDSGFNYKRLAGVLGSVLLLSLLFGSVYYLRGLANKMDVLHQKIDRYGVRIDGSIAAGLEDISGNINSIKKSVDDSGGESSESLKRVLIFLGDLRFKIKELEKKIVEVSEKPANATIDPVNLENVEESDDEGDPDQESRDTNAQPVLEDETELPSSDLTRSGDLEDLINRNSGALRELDEEFIGEVLDRMLVKRLAEYDLAKEEEELKKKGDNRLRKVEKNEKYVIAIEDSVKRVAEIGKRTLDYCKEKVFNAYEFLAK